ncbi:histone H3.v1-like isoform X2 [Hippocampus comes]|uniref:histone H3.v1-like isoform X2 n=1 Tax=Hippocampus comes TaxID=109280 RepID=UPI00094E6472|nr:PREDICTED: histone H3.v1-like isoform X2 [Hippocampus comes]
MYRAGIPNTSGKESKRGRLRRLKLSLPDVCGSCFIHDLVFLAAMSDIEEEYEDQAEEEVEEEEEEEEYEQQHEEEEEEQPVYEDETEEERPKPK